MNQDIYNYTINAIAEGIKVRINILKKFLKVDGQDLILEGRPLFPLGLEKLPSSKALVKIEELYEEFKYSLPSNASSRGRGVGRSGGLFKALPIEEIPDEYLFLGNDRKESRQRLELMFLLLTVNGSLTPSCPEFEGKWYWQSEKDRDLVILTEWLSLPTND